MLRKYKNFNHRNAISFFIVYELDTWSRDLNKRLQSVIALQSQHEEKWIELNSVGFFCQLWDYRCQ